MINPLFENVIPLEMGTRVHYKIGNLSGDGKIVGLVSTILPILGFTYIIDPDEAIRNSHYNYSHFAAFGSQLTLI